MSASLGQTGALSIRQQIRAAFVAALTQYSRLGNVRVSGPRDFPTTTADLPAVIVMPATRERMESLVRGAPSFTTTALIPVTARVAGTSIADVESQVEQLLQDIKLALFSYQPLLDLLQQFATVDTETVLTGEGEHQIGEISALFACEFPEFYDPAPGFPVTEIQTTLTDATSGKVIGSFDNKF